MSTLSELAHDFALDLTADAQTDECPSCGAGRLGVKLDCAACWRWHTDQKQPHPDQRSYIRVVLAEQRELAGEASLDAIAQAIAQQLASGPGPAIDREFFHSLESLAIRCSSMLLPTTRRRRVLREAIGYLILDTKVAVGLRPAGWMSAHLTA